MITICKTCKSRNITELNYSEQTCLCNDCKKFTPFITDQINTLIVVHGKTKELVKFGVYVINKCNLYDVHEQGSSETRQSVMALILRQQDYREIIQHYLEKHPRLFYEVIDDNVSYTLKKIYSKLLSSYTYL
jgi:hypothetical protein